MFSNAPDRALLAWRSQFLVAPNKSSDCLCFYSASGKKG